MGVNFTKYSTEYPPCGESRVKGVEGPIDLNVGPRMKDGRTPLYLEATEGKARHVVEDDRPCQVLHVISRIHGGECRGYYLFPGKLILRRPCSPARWVGVDQEVERTTGRKVTV